MQTINQHAKRLFELMRDGNSHSEIALQFHISKTACQRLRLAIARDLIFKYTGENIHRKPATAARLLKINLSADELFTPSWSLFELLTKTRKSWKLRLSKLTELWKLKGSYGNYSRRN